MQNNYKSLTSKVITVLILLFSIGTFSQADSLYEEIEVVSVPSRKIVVDGKMESAWKNAKVYFMGTYDGNINNLIVEKYLTTVRLLWDHDFLYVLFICVDDDIASTLVKHDSAIYQEEIGEVIISQPKNGTFIELSVNQKNTVFDSINHWNEQNERICDLSFNMKDLKNAVSISSQKNKDVKCWTLELAIPWKELNIQSVKHGSVLYGNFLRYERIANQATLKRYECPDNFLPLSIFPTHVRAWSSGSCTWGKIILQ